MNRLKFLPVLVLACCMAQFAGAQETAPNADLMRSNGKIYVVVAVVLTILAGLIIYVASIDRKISRIEKRK